MFESDGMEQPMDLEEHEYEMVPRIYTIQDIEKLKSLTIAQIRLCEFEAKFHFTSKYFHLCC